jgi:menaquinone-dependent protoporphyrinogen oxidase
MQDKILVTYSTRTGSTKGVSECIGKTLSDLGESVDVLPMQEINDLSHYKAVIAGSAIQAGKWLPEAFDFVKTHRDDLNKKPFAAFLVCMTLAMPKGESYRGTVSSWLDPIRNLVSPIDVGLFKGTLDVKIMPSFSDRFKFRMSVLFGIWKEGDHRDWVSIQNWTENLKSQLNKLNYSLN